MREIKFRVWDKEFRRFLTTHDLDVTQDMIKQSEKHSLVLSQYTGLCDDNGHDIYDGDIIQDKQGNKYPICPVPGGFAMSCFKQSLKKGFNYIEAGFYDSIANPQNAGWIQDQVIVGNIYENPELLHAAID